MKTVNELFEICAVEDITQGYTKDLTNNDFVCLICGKRFNEEEVFAIENKFYHAEKSVVLHIKEAHDHPLKNWLKYDKNITGLSDQQIKIINLIIKGYNDKDIAKEVGEVSESTIRNHRFKLREKARQAKLFLAIMNGVEESIQENKKFVTIPRTATMVDERYQVTSEEREKILQKYFNEKGQLIRYSKKEKERVVALLKIHEYFEFDKRYSEIEVDRIIKSHYLEPDETILRRAMIEYRLLDRKPDCSEYWKR